MKAKAINLNKPENPLVTLRKMVSEDLARVDALIYSLIANKISLIPEISEHTISAGGKRLRPILTLASARMCGYKGDAHIELAACVEFIHTATLLHDDVVDKSELRRGESTANNLWGNKESVLVGDYLLGKAFQLMGVAKSLEVYRVLSGAAVIISEGEVLQLAATGDLEGGKARYLEVITAKTAALFEASCHVGAVLAERNYKEADGLRKFGLNLGIAFQIMDDLLDYCSSSEAIGKSIGDDFREQKVTLPVILAYEKGSAEEREFWTRTIADGEQREGDVATAVGYIQHHNVAEEVAAQARMYTLQAEQALSVYPLSEMKSALLDILAFVVEREF